MKQYFYCIDWCLNFICIKELSLQFWNTIHLKNDMHNYQRYPKTLNQWCGRYRRYPNFKIVLILTLFWRKQLHLQTNSYLHIAILFKFAIFNLKIIYGFLIPSWSDKALKGTVEHLTSNLINTELFIWSIMWKITSFISH